MNLLRLDQKNPALLQLRAGTGPSLGKSPSQSLCGRPELLLSGCAGALGSRICPYVLSSVRPLGGCCTLEWALVWVPGSGRFQGQFISLSHMSPLTPSNKVGSHRLEDGASNVMLAWGAFCHHPNSKQNPFCAKASAKLPHPKQALRCFKI